MTTQRTKLEDVGLITTSDQKFIFRFKESVIKVSASGPDGFGSKPDSTEDPPSMGPVARYTIHTQWPNALTKKQEFHIKSLEIFEATSDTSVEFEVDEELHEVFDTTTDVEISPEEMPAFIYISGYVAKKVSQKLNCDLCTSKFITTRGLEYEIDTACKYVLLLDR
ncbi:hypothetical protein AVEN_142110-1 [Araneus ventricosus]|uniref:Uncharacterized protein n=1 Tax=Araneus ventricosus TaxID=182803 RepID=A0A4Y2KLK5_ARAVE|nr:hypothetical protein AVEN_142110-1 [Araneus ventricosus]